MTLFLIVTRFIRGAHLDGFRRMDSTFFKRGHTPRKHDNWWNRKSDFQRICWRFGPLLVGAVIVYGLVMARLWTLLGVGMVAPYVIERGVQFMHRQLAHLHAKKVHTAGVDDMTDELRDIEIPVEDGTISISRNRKDEAI